MEEKQTYTNVPDPVKEPKKFNNYLLVNNKVIGEGSAWILIANKYIEGQLVLFAKDHKAKYITDLSDSALIDMRSLLSDYKDLHMYINRDIDKSVPNRFHMHIKLPE